MFLAGVDRLGLDRDQRHQVVMIGDSPFYDTYAAKRVGLQTFQVDQDRTRYHVHYRASKQLADLAQSIIKFVHAGYRRVR
jgi:FMN phosphatase YigB (HAD superfamily)